MATETEKSEGKLIDMSRGGAFVEGCRGQTNQQCKFQLHLHRQPDLIQRCSIKRVSTGARGGIAVQFKSPISAEELKKVTGPLPPDGVGPASPETFRLALADQDEVSSDIRDVKACRSRIFMATIGAISAGSLAILGLASEGHLNPYGTFGATLLLFMLFVVGVLSIVEKARALNYRYGFLAALARYIAKNCGPANYKGWSEVRHCLFECGGRRDAGACPRGLREGDKTCLDEGEAAAAAVNSTKNLVPAMLDSFTSMSSFVFLGLYLAALVAIGLAMNGMLAQSITDFNATLALVLFASGVLTSMFVMRFIIAVVFMIIGFGLAVIMGALYGADLWAPVASFAAGVLLGSLGWFLLKQLYKVRSGRFSLETMTYAWSCAVCWCESIPEVPNSLPVPQRKGKFRRGARRFLLFILGEKPHCRTRQVFADKVRRPY